MVSPPASAVNNCPSVPAVVGNLYDPLISTDSSFDNFIIVSSFEFFIDTSPFKVAGLTQSTFKQSGGVIVIPPSIIKSSRTSRSPNTFVSPRCILAYNPHL